MKNVLRLKRNETFYIREGWLEKGINIIKNNAKCFSNNSGPSIFGLGSNMCKSLRYWLEACNIATFGQNGAFLSDFGEFLFNNDPFLETISSWWLIHIHLTRNKVDAPVINAFFNMDTRKTNKESFLNQIQNKFEREYDCSINTSSLESDILVMYKSYYSIDTSNPEDNLNCPLGKLNLLKIDDHKEYVKRNPTFELLDYRIVYYCLLLCLNEKANIGSSFNIEDLLSIENSPVRLLNLQKSSFLIYLDEMRKRDLISVAKTAGLNTITINKILTLSDLFVKEED